MAEDLIADLDHRIAGVEANIQTLKQEIAVLDALNPTVIRLSGIIAMGERSLEKLRAQRERLRQL